MSRGYFNMRLFSMLAWLAFTQTLRRIPDAPNSTAEAGYFMSSQVLFLPRKVVVVVSSVSNVSNFNLFLKV